MVDQQIARHASHPSREAAVRRPVAAERTIYAQEDILRQVFGFRPIARKPITNVEDPARMAAHKFLPGRPVALEALLDQLGVLLQRIISLELLATFLGLQLWNVNCSRNVP
jgi:hypothetical protein